MGVESRRREGVVAEREVTRAPSKIEVRRVLMSSGVCPKCKGSGYPYTGHHHKPSCRCGGICSVPCKLCEGSGKVEREVVPRAARKARGTEVADEDRRW